MLHQPLLCATHDAFARLDALLACVSVDAYSYQPPAGGSLGAQIRHTLDHGSALLLGVTSGVVDYDARTRGTPVETCPQAARQCLAQVLAGMEGLASQALDMPLAVVLTVTADGTQVRQSSTLALELRFVFSHTVHHLAVVSILARQLGMTLPHGFGMAPSTLVHERQEAVRSMACKSVGSPACAH